MGEQKNNQSQQQDINSLLKVRRDKLKELQDAGKDPFKIMKYNVTHHSKEVKIILNSSKAKLFLLPEE